MSEDAYVPPQNLEAEESVLGGMMMSAWAISAAAEILTEKDFYRPSHGTIYSTMIAMDEKGETVDALTTAAELERRNVLADIGGKFRIHELASVAPAIKQVPTYANIVREQAVRRNLIAAGMAIQETGMKGVGEPADLLALAEGALSGVQADREVSDFTKLSESASSLAAELVNWAEKGEERYGLKTHFPSLDRMLTGLHAGRLYILAARPSVGKSALAQNIATNVAVKGTGCMFFTLEMSKEELALRMLSRLIDVGVVDLQLAKLDLHKQRAIVEAATKLSAWPLYVEDNSSLRMSELRARARRHMRMHPDTGLLIVDYLQLMLTSGTADNRQQEVALISRSLKVLANELNIPIIALSQLSRGVEHRENKRPMLSDLRDSGAIEQDADVVLFLYRDSLYSKEDDPATKNDTELILAKNRMGETGTVKLAFTKRKELYREMARTGVTE